MAALKGKLHAPLVMNALAQSGLRATIGGQSGVGVLQIGHAYTPPHLVHGIESRCRQGRQLIFGLSIGEQHLGIAQNFVITAHVPAVGLRITRGVEPFLLVVTGGRSVAVGADSRGIARGQRCYFERLSIHGFAIVEHHHL